MKKIGIILSAVGVLVLLYSLSLDTSINGIHNFDMAGKKQNFLILSGISLILGIVLFAFGNNQNIQNAQGFTSENNSSNNSLKTFLPWIIGVIVIFGIYSYFKGINNKAVTLEQDVKESWGNVQTAYQRRNDLIGNLVKTVQGAAEYEKGTLTAVIEARAKATSVTIDPTNITPEQLAQFNQAQSGMSSALSRLLVTVEQYPSLKANENFLKLQDELASTENQILTARTRFNEKIEEYNNYVLKAPRNIILSEYKEKAFFKSVAGAEKAPDVEFNFDKKEETK
jgi:LemA protein